MRPGGRVDDGAVGEGFDIVVGIWVVVVVVVVVVVERQIGAWRGVAGGDGTRG
jgi:hypothetical protein